MLATEDILDGTNYRLWAYMLRHVLVANGLWNIVHQGFERSPIIDANIVANGDAEGVEDEILHVPIRVADPPPSTIEQVRQDDRDAQAHTLIALSSVKRAIIPHNKGCFGHTYHIVPSKK